MCTISRLMVPKGTWRSRGRIGHAQSQGLAGHGHLGRRGQLSLWRAFRPYVQLRHNLGATKLNPLADRNALLAHNTKENYPRVYRAADVELQTDLTIPGLILIALMAGGE